ncbi:MAG: TFIIB-type zinc ribbon-containing protein [Clostridiales bacterium]|nr:TFIIB-type zinc ribbon-containing protein [Clostridiales bacterium]
MSTMTFKCPCCGGYLEFDPSLQKFKCLYCGQLLSEEELREESRKRENESEAAQAEEKAAPQEKLQTYQCQMCGAEIVTDDTTAATRCYFCHSPVVLHDRLDDEFRPDGVIPFQLDKAAAEEQFLAHIKKKRFLDRDFFNSAQLEMFSGVYYPWWYTDVDGTATFDGEGEHTSVTSTPNYITTTHRVFHVDRQGKLSFRNIARKALTKADSKLSDGIHPYDVSGVKPYASGYLSGFLAEKRDVSEADAREQSLLEANSHAASLMKQNHSFNSLDGNTTFKAERVKSKYVLLPTWVLTYKGGKDGAPYYYMMNGQTGRVCGKLPIDKKRVLAAALGLGIAVFLLLCGGGAFIW